jgi:hypothetical protein
MKKAIKESRDDKNEATILKLKETISNLKKEKTALIKENAKLTKKNVDQYAKLITQRNRIVALEKVIPDTLKPKTLEDILLELDKKE